MENVQILTKADLDNFRKELLEEIKKLLSHAELNTDDKWLKTFDVKKILGVSSGTVQTMRDKGVIPFTRVGGLVLYKKEDIINFLEKNKTEGIDDIYSRFIIKKF